MEQLGLEQAPIWDTETLKMQGKDEFSVCEVMKKEEQVDASFVVVQLAEVVATCVMTA